MTPIQTGEILITNWISPTNQNSQIAHITTRRPDGSMLQVTAVAMIEKEKWAQGESASASMRLTALKEGLDELFTEL